MITTNNYNLIIPSKNDICKASDLENNFTILDTELKNINDNLTNHEHSASDITSGTLPVNRGGTGAVTAEVALQKLGLIATIGETININTNQCYTGYVSSDSKAITFSVPLPKWLPSNMSGVTINSVKLNIRKVAGGYIGGSSSFVSGGFEYIGDSNYTVSAEVSAACRHMILVTLTKKAKIDVVNNTPVSLVGTIRFTIN